MVVNMHEAKSSLSKLVERAEAGEEIVIGRAGKPVAVLIAYRPKQQPRTPGAWKGRVHIAEDFDDLPADLAEAFAGDAE